MGTWDEISELTNEISVGPNNPMNIYDGYSGVS